MKIKIVVLGANDYRENSDFDSVLRNVFSEHLENEDSVSYFPTLKDATVEVSKAFTQTDVVLFLIREDRYGTDKRILCKALGLSFDVDPVIRAIALHSAGDEYAEDRVFEETHCCIPRGAKSFVLDDGLYAGFAAEKGTQTTVILPYSNIRTEQLLEKQVIPYLNSSYKADIPTDYFGKRYMYMLSDALADNDLTVAVSGTNSAKILSEYISGDDVLAEAVKFSGHAEVRKNVPPNEYVVSLSITAAELLDAPYGIALSNAFYSGNSSDSEKTVYMAVTNDAGTVVRVVHSLPFEDVGDFMKRCCGMLCLLLSETITDDIGQSLRPEKKRKNPAKGLVTAVIVVILAIAGVIGYGIKTFTQNGYSLKKWYNTYLSEISNFKFDIDGENETTTQTVPQATASPGADSTKVLS